MSESSNFPFFDRIILLLNPTTEVKLVGKEFCGYKIEKCQERFKNAQYIEVEVLKGFSLEPKVAFDICRELKTKVKGVEDAEPLFYTLTPSEKDEFKTASKTTPPKVNWIFENLYIKEAWKLLPQLGERELVRIGHIDTGYTNHCELGTHVRKDLSKDFYKRGGGNGEDDERAQHYTHGTATASVIISPNIEKSCHEMKGIAPKTEIISIRTGGSVVYFSWGNVIDGIDYAIYQDCDIISMSLGGAIPSSALRRAIQRATNKGIIVIAAGGNKIPGRFVCFPARYPEVIAVAASNVYNKKWHYSSHGKQIAVTAPGEDVYRATWRNKEQIEEPSSGTSYATALVAGACVLWMQKHGKQNLKRKYGSQLYLKFKDIVMDPKNCTKMEDEGFGGGILDAKKLLSAVISEEKIEKVFTTVTIPTVNENKEEVIEILPEILGHLNISKEELSSTLTSEDASELLVYASMIQGLELPILEEELLYIGSSHLLESLRKLVNK